MSHTLANLSFEMPHKNQSGTLPIIQLPCPAERARRNPDAITCATLSSCPCEHTPQRFSVLFIPGARHTKNRFILARCIEIVPGHRTPHETPRSLPGAPQVPPRTPQEPARSPPRACQEPPRTPRDHPKSPPNTNKTFPSTHDRKRTVRMPSDPMKDGGSAE